MSICKQIDKSKLNSTELKMLQKPKSATPWECTLATSYIMIIHACVCVSWTDIRIYLQIFKLTIYFIYRANQNEKYIIDESKVENC